MQCSRIVLVGNGCICEGLGDLFLRFTQNHTCLPLTFGLGLATQADAVALGLDTAQIGDEDAEDAMLRILGRLLDRRPETIRALYENYPAGSWYIPLGEVSLEGFQAVEASVAAVGGVIWQPYTTRYYVNNGLAPQSVGYVSQIQEAEAEVYEARGYERDDMVGRTGIEAVYESQRLPAAEALPQKILKHGKQLERKKFIPFASQKNG